MAGRLCDTPPATTACPGSSRAPRCRWLTLICERLLAGRIGHLVADVAAEPALADPTWPARIGVNAYLGVPITSTSTRMYLLCCLARERRPDLGGSRRGVCAERGSQPVRALCRARI